MISSLLPGLRQSRSELASGALWVIGVWVLFGAQINSIVTGSSSESIQLLLAQIDGLVGLGVFTVVSYLVGMMWTTVVELARLRIWMAYIRKNPAPKVTRSSFSPSYLTSDFWRPFTFRSHRRILSSLARLSEGDEFDGGLFDDWSTEVMHEALSANTAILGSDRDSAQEMYGENVRVKAESELRDAIAIPLLLVASAAFWTLDVNTAVTFLAIALFAAICVVLVFMARISSRDANSQVLYWIALGYISTTSIEVAREGPSQLREYLDSQPLESVLE